MVTHKDLEIWKIGIELVEEIYIMTGRFPKEEMYGITSQMRQAAVSIPSNIAEGAARNSKKEFLQYLYIALGSLAELETQIIISKRLGFPAKEMLSETIEKLRRKLLNFIKHLKHRGNTQMRRFAYAFTHLRFYAFPLYSLYTLYAFTHPRVHAFTIKE